VRDDAENMAVVQPGALAAADGQAGDRSRIDLDRVCRYFRVGGTARMDIPAALRVQE